MKGATAGSKAARTAEAVAGPTPLRTVSSETAFETSGRERNAFWEADFTDSSSRDDTNPSSRGLCSNSVNNYSNQG